MLLGLTAFQNIGGGWIEAQNSRGEIGLVPEDYIEVRSWWIIRILMLQTPHIVHSSNFTPRNLDNKPTAVMLYAQVLVYFYSRAQTIFNLLDIVNLLDTVPLKIKRTSLH